METAQPPEMMHCVNSPETTVLERQRTRLLRWQHEQGTAMFQQQAQSFYNNNGGGGGGSSLPFYPVNENLMGLGEVINQCDMIHPSPGIEYWGQLGNIEVPSLGFGGGIAAAADASSSGYGVSCGSISRTASCATAAVEAAAGGQSAEKIGAPVGRDSFKKRKLERMQSIKDSEETRDRKIKGCFSETDSKITGQSNSNSNENKKDTKNRNCNNKDISASTSKDNSKAPDVQKPDYIHVRARRGQATDSHSLAERVRREKISERMKFLQDLVPGCNKITGKAGMLDEIINYVQSLQRQVEFLSLKLATVNPRLDFDVDSLFPKEMLPACTSSFPTIDMHSELTNRAYLHSDPSHQVVPCSGLDDMGIVNPDMGHQLTTSALMPVPEHFIEPSCFTPTATWDTSFQNHYPMEFQQGKASATAPAYQSHQQYTGLIEHNNMKMEI